MSQRDNMGKNMGATIDIKPIETPETLAPYKLNNCPNAESKMLPRPLSNNKDTVFS